MARTAANIVSNEYTGDTVLPANANRAYLFITMLDETGTVAFGEGTGTLPVDVGGYVEPIVTPTSKITIVTTGSFVVCTG